MSLNWDLRAIESRDLSEEGLRVTESLIWGTIATGIGEITADNWAEFHARLVFGAKLDGIEDHVPSPQKVRAHIGLKTNVFPNKTRAQWLRRFGNDLDALKKRAQDEVRGTDLLSQPVKVVSA